MRKIEFVLGCLFLVIIVTGIRPVEANVYAKLPGIQLTEHEIGQIFGGEYVECQLCVEGEQCTVGSTTEGCSHSDGRCSSVGALCGDSDGCSGPRHYSCDSEGAEAEDSCQTESMAKCCTTTFDNSCVQYSNPQRCICDGIGGDKSYYSRQMCTGK